MTFTQSIKTCFNKYIDFSGRASRSEYWWFFLFTLIARIVTAWIPGVGFVVTLVLILPSLSVTVRRLHDTNRTGWWLLLPIGITLAAIILGVVLSFVAGPILGVGIGVVGSITGFVALLVFLIQAGDPYANQYGPDPLLQGAVATGFGGAGNPYASPSSDADYAAPSFDNESSDLSQLPEGEQRRYCTQCGMQLQPEARFCTACGSAA